MLAITESRALTCFLLAWVPSWRTGAAHLDTIGAEPVGIGRSKKYRFDLIGESLSLL